MRARIPATDESLLPVIGLYAWRRDGEHHQWNPETIALLQDAVRNGRYETYEEYSRAVNEDAVRRYTLRGLLRFREAPDGGIPLDEVEPASEIVKRFATGAMSLGSISREAHETLAIAMNRIGGRSNTRRGRRGPRPLHARPERRPPPLRDQAGRVRPLRRHDRLPHERRRAADQDGAGREARRGRPAPGSQGRPLHRERAPDDSRRRPHLAAAAPRHLLDRGPEAAHLRPPLREPEGACLGEARGRGRRRHRRRRGREGERRPRPHLRTRRRHRRLAALVDPVRGDPVGDRPRRDAADARPQRPPLAHLGADRRAAEDGPRRRRRCAARRRRVRVRDGAADRERLRDDARLPPQHVPGRDRDPGSRAAPTLRGPARARRQLLLLRRRGGAADHGHARRPPLRGSRRPRRPARGRRRASTSGRSVGST